MSEKKRVGGGGGGGIWELREEKLWIMEKYVLRFFSSVDLKNGELETAQVWHTDCTWLIDWLIDWYIYLDRIAEKQVHAYQSHVPVCAFVRAFLYVCVCVCVWERERGA